MGVQRRGTDLQALGQSGEGELVEPDLVREHRPDGDDELVVVSEASHHPPALTMARSMAVPG